MHIEICGREYNENDVRYLETHIGGKCINTHTSIFFITRGAVCPVYSSFILYAMPVLDRMCHSFDIIVLVSDYDNAILSQSHAFSTNLTLVHVPSGRCNEKLPASAAIRFKEFYPGLNMLSLKASLLNSSSASVPGHVSCDNGLNVGRFLLSSENEVSYYLEREISLGEVRSVAFNLPPKLKSLNVMATLCYKFWPDSGEHYNDNDITFSFDGVLHELNCVESEERHGNVTKKQLRLDSEALALLDDKLNVHIVSRNENDERHSRASSSCIVSFVISIFTDGYKHRKRLFYNSINSINKLRNVDVDRYNYLELPYIDVKGLSGS